MKTTKIHNSTAQKHMHIYYTHKFSRKQNFLCEAKNEITYACFVLVNQVIITLQNKLVSQRADKRICQ